IRLDRLHPKLPSHAVKSRRGRAAALRAKPWTAGFGKMQSDIPEDHCRLTKQNSSAARPHDDRAMQLLAILVRQIDFARLIVVARHGADLDGILAAEQEIRGKAHLGVAGDRRIMN